MKPAKESIIEQIDSILKSYYDDVNSFEIEQTGESNFFLIQQNISRIQSAITRLSPPGSSYKDRIEDIFSEKHMYFGLQAEHLAGILKALRDDYGAGYLETVHELIHADLFSDFIEMAQYLLDEGYKDPAAVLAGGVLEEHLKKLYEKVLGISSSGKTCSPINTELYKAPYYNKAVFGEVESWIKIRNYAAHAEWGEYDKDQVSRMIQGIRSFIANNPA